MAKRKDKMVQLQPVPLAPPTHLDPGTGARVAEIFSALRAAQHLEVQARVAFINAANDLARIDRELRATIDAARPGHQMGPRDTVDPTTGAITRAAGEVVTGRVQ